MKICTITCHDVYNHGASMQAYALMTYLESIGNDVEIIDYKPDYLSNYGNLLKIYNPAWEKNIITKLIYLMLKMPRRIIELKRKKAFDKFTRKHLKLTKQKYKNNKELKLNIPDADAYICGSDQIWNSLRPNGKDEAFYLDFVPNNKIKCAYAASFATDDIADEYKKFVKEKISKLDGIGIREKSGVEIVKDLGINNAVNVVDPVFLLDKEKWDNIGNDRFNEKYLLIYDFDKSKLVEEVAVKIAKEKGYKIYSISSDRPKYVDRFFDLSGPETFVSLIRNAEIVISNSFHSVVFSVIYNKNIVVINRNENINTRMRDLLEDLGLKHKLIDENYNMKEILKEIDYIEVNKILKEKIEFSKKYINNVLSKNNNFKSSEV